MLLPTESVTLKCYSPGPRWEKLEIGVVGVVRRRAGVKSTQNKILCRLGTKTGPEDASRPNFTFSASLEFLLPGAKE